MPDSIDLDNLFCSY